MCGTMDDAGVECEGKVLLLFQKSLLLSSSDIIFDFKIGVIDILTVRYISELSIMIVKLSTKFGTYLYSVY
jgi:hypothetical protein